MVIIIIVIIHAIECFLISNQNHHKLFNHTESLMDLDCYSGVLGSVEGTGLMVATEALPLVLTTSEVGSIPTAVPNGAAEASNEQTPTTITFIPYADGEIKVLTYLLLSVET